MKIKSRLFLWLLLPGFLFSSCQSISRIGTDMNMLSFMIIFSFDDGPNARDDTTERLLDVLKKYEVRGMFALLGENAEAYPELVKRIFDEGHLIVNHGYSGKLSIRMGQDEFRNNLLRGEAAISAALGEELYPKLYRPHGGFFSSSQKKVWQEAGYVMVPANLRIYDTVLTAAKNDKAFKRIIKKIDRQGGGIILLHDGKDSHFLMEKKLEKNPQGAFNRSWIPGLVEEIITALLSKGYILNNHFPFENIKTEF